MALINQPRVWSTVFITQRDRRSFVKACLERSHPVTLDVTVDASKLGRVHPACTCEKGRRGMLLPNESNPCEWHFQFEPLADTRHSDRVRVLDISFDNEWVPLVERARYPLGSCRFFTSSFPRLATLTWKNKETNHADYLFSTSPFVPTLRSLTYVGAWSSLIAQVNNLTSFVFENESRHTNTEAVRLFMRNNRSLESLSLNIDAFEGTSKGPPAHLLNLKSLTVGIPVKKLSTIFRVPAFRRLSSLQISSDSDADIYTLSATGDDITLTAKCYPRDFTETWEDLTGEAKPVIRHIRLYDDGSEEVDHSCGDNSTIILLMVDAQTLEVGLNYATGWYRSFWDDLKQLGTQLKTIRFEVSGEMEPCPEDGYLSVHDDTDSEVWDSIEDLVKYRFDQGRPFSTVERLVTSENERENRMQDYVWRCFYGCRQLGQYVRVV